MNVAMTTHEARAIADRLLNEIEDREDELTELGYDCAYAMALAATVAAADRGRGLPVDNIAKLDELYNQRIRNRR